MNYLSDFERGPDIILVPKDVPDVYDWNDVRQAEHIRPWWEVVGENKSVEQLDLDAALESPAWDEFTATPLVLHTGDITDSVYLPH